MSSSVGNNIPLAMAPEEQFGRTMRIPTTSFRSGTRARHGSRSSRRRPARGQARAGPLHRAPPATRRLLRAPKPLTRVVREGQAPAEVAEVPLPAGDGDRAPAGTSSSISASASTSEARRMISQGGVKVNGEVVSDLDLPRTALEGALVQAGKRRFMRFGA